MINLTALDIFNYLGEDIALAIIFASSLYLLYKVIGHLFEK